MATDPLPRPEGAPTADPGSTSASWYRRPLQRRPEDAPLGGVIAAVALAYGFDPRLTRLATVAITLIMPVMVLVYLVAWLVIPAAPAPGESLEDLLSDRRRLPIYVALLAVAVLGGGGLLTNRRGFELWPGLPAMLSILLVLVILLALIGRRWLPLLVLPPVILLGAGYLVAEPTLSGGWGTRTVTAEQIRAAEPLVTELAGGRLRIDLRDITPGTLPTRVTAAVGVGDLEIMVPPGNRLRLSVFLGTGRIRLDGEQLAAGIRQRATTSVTGSGPLITLDLRMGLGVIEITRGQ